MAQLMDLSRELQMDALQKDYTKGLQMSAPMAQQKYLSRELLMDAIQMDYSRGLQMIAPMAQLMDFSKELLMDLSWELLMVVLQKDYWR